MSFESLNRTFTCRLRELLTIALALAAGGFTLCGTAAAQEREKNEKQQAAESGQNVELRGHAIYVRVQEFAAADVNGDGKLSRSERAAFLVALAMQSGEALITEYPKTDRDQDGKLSVAEAVDLVQGRSARADLERRTHLEAQAAEKEGVGERQFKEMKAAGRRANLELWMQVFDTQEWLLDNMTREPDPDKMAEYDELIKRAERADFLKKHPEADADGDGLLSAEELQAYNDSRWSRRLIEIREEIEQMLAKLDNPDLKPGQVRELQGRLKKLRGMEAEYAGALEAARARHP